MELRQDRTPLIFINHIFQEYKNSESNIFLEFSFYRSGGEGITLSREVFRLKLDEGIFQKISDIKSSLLPGVEFAIHSVLTIGRQRKYLPFVDFATQNWEILNTQLNEKIYSYLKSRLFLFSTGRSFHCYALRELSYAEWTRFLGFLLLLNGRGLYLENVDSRWVGHSLEQGYGSLRLSSNTSEYLKEPELLMIRK